MKLRILLILFATFSLGQAQAHNAHLCAAVRGNDFERVMTLLDHGANLNEEDAFGRRPLFYVSNPEMARLLFARGALIATHRGSDQIHTDSTGRNPLHFLFGYTAPNLLRNARNGELDIMKQLEDTAYVILMARIQEVGSRILLTRTRLESMPDAYRNLPSAYLRDRPWNPNFVERMSREHERDYRYLSATMGAPNEESPSIGSLDVPIIS